MSRLIARVFAAFSISALILTALALPVAAGPAHVPQTLVVDDNATQCPDAGYSSIQDAIDDAGTGDKILVCAGYYPEQLLLNKQVKVKSKPLFAAHIVAPGDVSPTNSMIAPVVVMANASLIGFRLDMEAGPAFTGVRPSALSCQHIDAGILVLGSNTKVKSNKLSAPGEATLSGACGYDYGIVVTGDGGTGVRPTGTTTYPTNVKVTFNWVTNFKIGGILVTGADTTALVRRNTMRFLHEGETSGCAPVVGVCARPSVDSDLLGTYGIGVDGGAEVNVIRNAVKSGEYAETPRVIASTPRLQTGIALNAPNAYVFHNAIWRVGAGIRTYGPASGGVISYNHVTTSSVGLLATGSNDSWHHNHVHNNGIGIQADAGVNSFEDNSAHDNTNYDCYDSTTGGGTAGTNNFWDDNEGVTDQPDGICTQEPG
jgi:hypothetical protein